MLRQRSPATLHFLTPQKVIFMQEFLLWLNLDLFAFRLIFDLIWFEAPNRILVGCYFLITRTKFAIFTICALTFVQVYRSSCFPISRFLFRSTTPCQWRWLTIRTTGTTRTIATVVVLAFSFTTFVQTNARGGASWRVTFSLFFSVVVARAFTIATWIVFVFLFDFCKLAIRSLVDFDSIIDSQIGFNEVQICCICDIFPRFGPYLINPLSFLNHL